jgi:Family of unknown function (DUF6188)
MNLVPKPPFIRSSDGRVRQGEMVCAASIPALQFDGADLTSIRIDFQIHLHFDETTVTIGTPFRLTVGGKSHALDPDARSKLGPLLAIYPGKLQSASINSELTLRLEITGGAVIEIPVDRSFEAWEISGPESRLIVCPPAGEGGLAVWS